MNRKYIIIAGIVVALVALLGVLLSRRDMPFNPPSPPDGTPVATSSAPQATSSVSQPPIMEDFDITAADNGKNFAYGVTSRFSVLLDQTAHKKEDLICTPQGIIGSVSNAPAVEPPLFATRFEAVKAGTCSLSSGDFKVTIRVYPERIPAAETVIKGYYEALTAHDAAKAHGYLAQAFGAALPVDRLQGAADAFNFIRVTSLLPTSTTSSRITYETNFDVSIKPDMLTSFEEGKNIRYIGMVVEKGAWKIEKITLTP